MHHTRSPIPWHFNRDADARHILKGVRNLIVVIAALLGATAAARAAALGRGLLLRAAALRLATSEECGTL